MRFKIQIIAHLGRTYRGNRKYTPHRKLNATQCKTALSQTSTVLITINQSEMACKR